MAKIANKILDIPQHKHDWRVSSVLVSIVKSEEKLSYWGLVKHFEKHPGDLKRCELLRPYSKSQYQLQLSHVDTKILQQIIVWMAGDEAVDGTTIVDSSGFNMSRLKDWINAKYGKLSVRDFVKLHAIHTPQGKICAAMVTHGEANDSLYLRKMIKMMPNGSGNLLGDSAYGGVENCDAVRDSGRRPIIYTNSNAIPTGDNARAEMLRFRDEYPCTF